MRIIKHGNKYELGEITCKKCGCIFAYTVSDTRTELVTEYDDAVYGKDTISQTVVNCPECHYMLEVHI